ncbi:MAG: hypothetical protein P8R54_24325, partial [Myxococcota bacterium]|nr:hypothetical protein [Myxococcota bacterium]
EVFVLNAQENISAREVEFAEEYASRVEGEAVAGEAVAGEAAGGEAVTVDSVAGEDVAGEDVAGEDVAGEDVAGEGIAGEGIAGEDVAVDSVEPETFAAAEEAAAVVEDAVNSARAEPSGITFSSLESDTAKVIVRCDEEKSRGAERATIALASANSCTVTAIRSDRSRLTAVVPGATAGSYTCFVGGESKCERE